MLDRLVADNVILITSGSLTKEENAGGSIIKIYDADKDIREKIQDHIIYCGYKDAYIKIQETNPLTKSKEVTNNFNDLDRAILTVL